MTYIDMIESANPNYGHDYFDPAEFEARAFFEGEHYWHVHRREILLCELRAVCPDQNIPLIEVGCGIGTVATHLNASGFTVDYCDVHRAGLDLARRRSEARLEPNPERKYIRLDVTRSRIPGDYGGILMLDVLEHLDDELAALENLRASLGDNPDAFAMITVPAFDFLWSPWDDIEKHKRRYTKRSLTEAANRAGFRVERATYFFLPLFFAALGMKWLRTLRNQVGKPRVAKEIGELMEGKSHPLINSVARQVLGPERHWLNTHDLGLGTSLLAVLRPTDA
jgi:2-polyprenyl-3-methyl-5-hydroxy-6-metoxy-1,4-benzoquinol methylase